MNKSEAEQAKKPAARHGALLLAVATAVMKNLLENGLAAHGVTASLGADTAVSALPPDRIATGADERPGLNLFLYEAAPRGLVSAGRNGASESAGASLPRALELRYLVTAYGAHDLDMEILLGYAIETLRREAVVRADRIAAILSSLSDTAGAKVVPPALAALSAPHSADLASQIDIRPQQLDAEAMSRLWSTLQARFRPSVAYKVTLELDHADPSGN